MNDNSKRNLNCRLVIWFIISNGALAKEKLAAKSTKLRAEAPKSTSQKEVFPFTL
jgi:hypothetical protein